MRPIRAVRMSRGPGPQPSRGTAVCRTGHRRAHGTEAQLAAEQRAGCRPQERDNALNGADGRAGDARSRTPIGTKRGCLRL
jgi:hypothetical protein